jgi:8-oxo-dGTP diphosphatase
MTNNINYPLFCQFCGSKELERNIKESAFKCHRCGRTSYLNSKPSVCAVIIRNNKVFLVRNIGSSWDLPGGFLLYGESPEDGLKRELMEELNTKIEIERLLTALVDVYGNNGEFSLNLFYKVNLISDEVKTGAEIEEYKWFDINKLPPIAFESTIKVLSNIKRYNL